MGCLKCGGTIHDWFGDAWCDACNGVVVPNADGTRIIFRHVATVDGPAGRYPVAWDESAHHYLFRWPNKVNPKAGKMGIDGDIKRPKLLTSFGPLDMVLMQALTAARGNHAGVPELSVAPSSTDDERAMLGV